MPEFKLDEISLELSNFRCNVSVLHRKPIYKRLDGSEYIDHNTSLEVVHVCGTGSKLNGVEQ